MRDTDFNTHKKQSFTFSQFYFNRELHGWQGLKAQSHEIKMWKRDIFFLYIKIENN